MKALPFDPQVQHSPSLPTVFLMANDLEMGGTQKHFAQLAKALHGNFRVRLGCNRRQGYFAEALRTEWEIAEFELGGSFFSSKALHSARALARYLRLNEVRIAHSFSFYSNLMMIPVARMARVPIVIGSHRQLGDLLTPLQFTAQLTVLKLCDRIVCNSQAAAQRLVMRGLSPTKTVVIPNAVSPEIFAVGNRGKQALRGSPANVGMIARISAAGKDHALLLRAAARLRNQSRSIQLFLAGDGPQRLQLESLTQQMGLASQVTFLGQCPDLAGLLAKLDISVLASSSESSPNAITESMAAGLSIVATRVGGIPELISHGENGLLVPVGDEVQLAEAIWYLAENPEVRARFGQNAFDFASRYFRLNHVCRLYEKLYAELLDSRQLTP
jgi:glycosyltransferase involved in cell wall biosynthesis